MASESTRILMFHRVIEDVPAAFDLPNCYRMRGTALTTAELSRLLDNAGPILALDEVEQALEAGVRPPPGCVLTFDDGYREHLDVVAPLLADRGATATFYVATGLHGGGQRVAAVDAWYWLLDHAAQRIGQVPLPDGGAYQGPLDTNATKTVWVGGLPKVGLLAATPPQQAEMIAALAASLGCALPADLAAQLYLSRQEWVSLVQLGMRVGAHSVGHPRLTQLDDRPLLTEVAESVAAVAALAGPVAFAYPDGAHDDRVVNVVRRIGASSGVTCVPGGVPWGADVMRLPRVFVTPRFCAEAINGP